MGPVVAPPRSELRLPELPPSRSLRRGRRGVIKETPLNRFAPPEEIAQIAVFLALVSAGWCSS
jgi:NAD(P)-dependent dehydrogenase (short-subunit alcohol dehydrogenase family)